MRFKIIKSVLSFSLIAVIMIYTVSSTVIAVGSTAADTSKAQTGPAEIKSKNEVVYATLAATGTVNALYVVNHFEIEESGSITDYGNYKSVLNLTESNPISLNGDSVSFQTDEENFYYQGNMDKTDLPWTFEITYDLDGVSMSPQEIAGKTGKLGIHINAAKNESINSTFFENYMLQITLTLSSDKCKNIDAPEATIADAGKNKILAFTVMPNKGADIHITTDAKDFTMSGIEISAMPFSISMDLPDTDEMLAEFNQLPEAISVLNDGIGKLADGTLELKNGANDLKNGSIEFKNGLSDLDNNAGSITDASAQIKDALVLISSSMNDSSLSEMDLSGLTQLPLGLSQLAEGLRGISGGLLELKTGFTTASAALDTAIQGIPSTVITREEIDVKFPGVSDDQRNLLDQLYASYTAGQTVKGTYDQVQQAFAAVAPTIDTLTANIDTISESLDAISSQLGSSLSGMDIMDQLDGLSAGLSDLASNYEAFDKGLNDYMDGVGKISDGYNQLNSGLSEFSNGVGELNDGVEDLYDGTDQLNDEVSKMPDRMQEEIDKLMSEYDRSDFLPVSYVSDKNENTELVQFVLKSEEIELPKDTNTTEVTEETKDEETVWDRFVALFR